jgi:hypothetical protein
LSRRSIVEQWLNHELSIFFKANFYNIKKDRMRITIPVVGVEIFLSITSIDWQRDETGVGNKQDKDLTKYRGSRFGDMAMV